MRQFDVDDVTKQTIQLFDDEIKEVKSDTKLLVTDIQKLLILHSKDLPKESQDYWSGLLTSSEKEVKSYTTRMFDKAYQVRHEESSRRLDHEPETVGHLTRFESEQLEILRKRNELLKKSQENKANDSSRSVEECLAAERDKTKAALASANNKSEAIESTKERQRAKANKEI